MFLPPADDWGPEYDLKHKERPGKPKKEKERIADIQVSLSRFFCFRVLADITLTGSSSTASLSRDYNTILDMLRLGSRTDEVVDSIFPRSFLPSGLFRDRLITSLRSVLTPAHLLNIDYCRPAGWSKGKQKREGEGEGGGFRRGPIIPT